MELSSRQLVLWLPVCFVAGALRYLSLNQEPNFALAALPIVPCVWATHHAWRRGYRVWPLLLGLFVATIGFGWTQIYTVNHQVTMLKEELPISQMSGRIVAISDVPKGYRITLDMVSIEGLEEEQTPERIRVKLRGSAGEALLTGQRIQLRAGLLSPTGPVMPGAFDFARYFYFQGIGAVGYGIPPVTVTRAAGDTSFWEDLTHFRSAFSARIRAQMSRPEGAVAAALMTGDRAAIPEEVNQVMRDTNLSHILAISGMHMALVTGLLFFSLRWLLAALPAARYMRQPKKLAALFALIAGAAYLLIAGLPISACRAYMMVALVFGAILLDRQVMPMRSLAIAAVVLLLINPSYAIQAGFQLSFIATAALIAWYERVRYTAEHFMEPGDRPKRVLLYLGGVMMTSLVAELATAPLVLYHFNSVSFYGLLANLIIMPIVSFWIMPAIVMAFLLMPLGLEALALAPVEWGIGAMIAIARWVANIPGAHMFFPAPPGWAMAAAMLGLFWLLLVRSRARLWGLLGVPIMLLGYGWVSTPQLLISSDGKQIAAEVDGRLQLLKGRARSFVPQQWANGSGHRALDSVAKDSGYWRCDAGLGCVFRYDDHVIAFPDSFEAQASDCRRAEVVVSPFYLYQRECDAVVIDRRARKERGAHWVWLQGDDMRIETSRDLQGDRPWSH